MDQGPIGLAALLGGQIGGWRIEPVLEQDIVVELGWQGPGQAGAPDAVDVFADGALGQTQAGSGGTLGEPDTVVQAQDFADVAHRQSLGGHLGPRLGSKSQDYRGLRTAGGKPLFTASGTDHGRWNERSRSSGNHDHDALEWMITILWNP